MALFRGTSVDQDSRYFAQNKKLLAKLSFPPCFDQKVDLTKVKREVIAQWITERVTQLLGFDDDIVVAMIINLLEPKVDEKLDPRQLQLTITGFLEKDAPRFMQELWELLLSAQAHPTGIPPAILEKKKLEMAQAAEHKQQLRSVLDRKRDDAVRDQKQQQQQQKQRDAEPKPKTYGLVQAGAPRTNRFSDRAAPVDAPPARRERDRSAPRPDSRRRHRSPSPPRRSRVPSRSRSKARRRTRSPSLSRSPSRSRSRSRSHSRSASRSPSRSRSRSRGRGRARERHGVDSRGRSRKPRGTHRSPSPSPPERRRSRNDHGRRRSPSPSPVRKRRSRSPPSRSSSPDQFGRTRRRTLSKSPSRSRSRRQRSRSRSASK